MIGLFIEHRKERPGQKRILNLIFIGLLHVEF